MATDFIRQIKDLPREDKISYAGFIIGGIILAISVAIYASGDASLQATGAGFFLIGLMIAVTPYGLLAFLRRRNIKAMEKYLPPLLEDVAESRRSGMSLSQAFENAARRDYGALNPVIHKMASQLSWGIPFPEVMDRALEQVKSSEILRRSFFIINQSYRSGGDVAQTIESLAQDSLRLQDAEESRKSTLGQQILIVYVIYFLFIGVLVSLFVVMRPLLGLGSDLSAALGGGGSGVSNLCNTNIDATKPMCALGRAFGWEQDALLYYRSLFLLMILVEGIFNGLVAGEVGEGKVAAGFKHAMIMTPIGFLLYLVAVAVI